MPRINHVLLTRFNLPTAGTEGLIRARAGWLEDRVALFERYCLPSVASQSVADVTWIIYLDPESPSWLLDRLADPAARGLFRPILRESVSREELISDIEEAVPHKSEILLTSNVDNDDALASDFIETLGTLRTDHERVGVYRPLGLVRGPDGLFLHRDRRNAFCSVREPWDAPVTAWGTYHNELGTVMPVVELPGAPAWLQVVHGANVSNRVRGRLVSPAPYRARFPGLLDDVPAPDARGLVLDRWIRRPARSVRDGGRTALRRTGLRILGKERYSKAKERLFVLTRS